MRASNIGTITIIWCGTRKPFSYRVFNGEHIFLLHFKEDVFTFIYDGKHLLPPAERLSCYVSFGSKQPREKFVNFNSFIDTMFSIINGE